MPSAKDQGFTEDQIEDFKEVFQLFDTKGDGLIQVRRKLVLTRQASDHSLASPLYLACDLDSHNMGGLQAPDKTSVQRVKSFHGAYEVSM